MELQFIINSLIPQLARGFLTTLHLTAWAAALGMICGIVMGTVMCKQLKVPGIAWLLHAYVAIIRGTPLYIQILIIYYVLPDMLGIDLSAFTGGVIALACNSTAYVAETVRAGINALPRGQWEACYVLGYSRTTTLFSIILPQTLRNVLPSLTSEVTTLLKETSILSVVGVLEIVRVGQTVNNRLFQPLPIYLTVALFYFAVTTLLTLISQRFEQDHT